LADREPASRGPRHVDRMAFDTGSGRGLDPACTRDSGRRGACRGASYVKALITGGGGFLGSRLAAALRERDPDAAITLVDVAFPPGLAERFECVTGDLASQKILEKALAPDTDAIFHLAAVVSGGAEADFDLGYHVNLD